MTGDVCYRICNIDRSTPRTRYHYSKLLLLQALLKSSHTHFDQTGSLMSACMQACSLLRLGVEYLVSLRKILKIIKTSDTKMFVFCVNKQFISLYENTLNIKILSFFFFSYTPFEQFYRRLLCYRFCNIRTQCMHHTCPAYGEKACNCFVWQLANQSGAG